MSNFISYPCKLPTVENMAHGSLATEQAEKSKPACSEDPKRTRQGLQILLASGEDRGKASGRVGPVDPRGSSEQS